MLLTKVTKQSKNKLQAKTNLSTIRFRRALDNSKQDVTTYCGCLPLSYTFLYYYNGLLKILQKVQICSVGCTES